MAASNVRLPTAGSGPYVQTFQNTIAATAVEAQGVVLVNSAGTALDAPSSEVAIPVGGTVAHDGADSGSPIKIGGKGVSALPTAVTGDDRVNAYFNLYGELHTISGGTSITISQTPTIDTSAHTAGDAVGGKLTFAGAVRKSGGTGIIESVTLTDLTTQAAAIKLVLFNQDFTATTTNNPMDVGDSDLVNMIGIIPIASADYTTFADNCAACVRSVGLRFTASGSTSIYGQLVTSGTPTYTTSSDLKISIVIKYD